MTPSPRLPTPPSRVTALPLPLLAPALLLLLPACSPVSSSGIQTAAGVAPYTGPVAVAATTVPAGAVEVGIAQAAGVGATVDQLIPEFVNQVAALGGNFGLVEQVSTQYETRTVPQTYTYTCGNSTCTGTNYVTQELATTQVVGRAFRVEGLIP
jgi:hypothetical protein